MKILTFIIIISTILILTPSVFSLTAAENVTLTDMYNQWGSKLKWKGSPCISWTGIVCNGAGNVIQMFVKLKFVNCY